jgi:hypothetical protein
LERAAHYLREYPEADSAIGLHVFEDGLRIRVKGGVRIVGPEEFVQRSSPAAMADCVGIVRQNAIQEWRSADRDYFNADFALVLRLHLSHTVVLVDEPWGRYDETAFGRVTDSGDRRGFEDVGRFVRDVRPLIGASPCGPVDVVLVSMWARLMKKHRYREAEALTGWMAERGISRRSAVRRKLAWSLRWRAATKTPSLVEVL